MVLRDNRFIMIREIEVLPAWRHDVGLKLTWNRALKSLSWSWNSHFSHVIWGKMSFAIAMLTLYFFEFYFRSLWMTSSNGDIFRVIGPLRGEFTGRQWRGALVFSVICACATGWLNSLNAVELRRHRAHYDITVMSTGIVPPDGRWCPGVCGRFDHNPSWLISFHKFSISLNKDCLSLGFLWPFRHNKVLKLS